MTWLDAIFVVFLVLGALRGLFTGKLLPLLIIFAVWIMSIAMAVNFEKQLGDTFGDFRWYPLLAFFIILVVIQVAIYWSGIPQMVMSSIRWRPDRWMNMVGGVLLNACIVAIYCGLIWRILTVIAVAVAIRPGFSVDGTGLGATFYNLVFDSALRSGLVDFVDAYEPPLGVVLGSVIGAALVGLAIYGRLRAEGSDAWADDMEPDASDGELERRSEAASRTDSL
jgi:hypothetical protein